MSWHYLQAQAEASWDPSCSDGLSPALSRLIPSPVRSCLEDKPKDISTDSRSGMTCRRSTATRGAVQLTLYPAVSHAKTSVSQVKEKGSPEIVRRSSMKCFELLKKYDLVLFSRKIRRAFVPLAWAPSSQHLPAWGMTALGACWELGIRALPTSETECGYLPTPTANSYGSNQGGGSGRVGKVRPSLWSLAAQSGGKLNPRFTEFMMGWPIGWTSSERLEMDKFRKWRRLHFKS